MEIQRNFSTVVTCKECGFDFMLSFEVIKPGQLLPVSCPGIFGGCNCKFLIKVQFPVEFTYEYVRPIVLS